VWCRLPQPLSSALTVAAERYGVYLAAGPSFAPSGGLEHYLRLPYTAPPDRLTEAVRRIAEAWREAPQEQRGTRGRAPVVA
jgi:DNA-binding transcriptional MocR family regulator